METIVNKAENAIKSIQQKNKSGTPYIKLTVSQIRKILTAVNILRNKVDMYKINNLDNDNLSDDLRMEVEFLRVNIAYQAGKDTKNSVKDFIDKAHLIEEIKAINGSIKKFEQFCKYVEALVAFHKYYGGKD